MRALIQRVKRASVAIGGQVRGQSGRGLLILLGVQEGDAVSIYDLEFEYQK